MTNEVVGHCEKCGSIIDNPVEACQAMGGLYHTKCFVCQKCRGSLKGSSYYYLAGFIYCERDFKAQNLLRREQDSVETCSTCHKPVLQTSVSAMQRSFHPSCFVCGICARNLVNEDFHPSPNDPNVPLCLNDYWSLVAPTCSFCCNPIEPSRESNTLIVAKTFATNAHIPKAANFHPHCLASAFSSH